MKELFMTLPWWVRWVAIPVIAVVVFGGLLLNLLSFLVWLAFKILVFTALVAVLIFLVRKFSSSSSGKSRGDW
ncbi:DUF5326 family protein [Streptomyces aidingensis]|uniref:DUF5326 family protein n=1 Tax=Streptomyces aidingensis TaxID=910347 RepID=A0A1I1QNQ7_9ACTN|nr:DUF5326 family protein [Streptomyces aidingensis]SFD21488.1 hypothetical protein SAMN05421773_111112 [Streptomyces aidingensis]